MLYQVSATVGGTRTLVASVVRGPTFTRQSVYMRHVWAILSLKFREKGDLRFRRGRAPNEAADPAADVLSCQNHHGKRLT